MPVPNILGAVSRRRTLALGLLTLAGWHGAAGVEGKKNKRRSKADKCDRRVQRAITSVCGAQVDSCVRSAEPVCERSRDFAACQAAVRQCCGHMGSCDLDGYLACMDALITPLVTP